MKQSSALGFAGEPSPTAAHEYNFLALSLSSRGAIVTSRSAIRVVPRESDRRGGACAPVPRHVVLPSRAKTVDTSRPEKLIVISGPTAIHQQQVYYALPFTCIVSPGFA